MGYNEQLSKHGAVIGCHLCQKSVDEISALAGAIIVILNGSIYEPQRRSHEAVDHANSQSGTTAHRGRKNLLSSAETLQTDSEETLVIIYHLITSFLESFSLHYIS